MEVQKRQKPVVPKKFVGPFPSDFGRPTCTKHRLWLGLVAHSLEPKISLAEKPERSLFSLGSSPSHPSNGAWAEVPRRSVIRLFVEARGRSTRTPLNSTYDTNRGHWLRHLAAPNAQSASGSPVRVRGQGPCLSAVCLLIRRRISRTTRIGAQSHSVWKKIHLDLKNSRNATLPPQRIRFSAPFPLHHCPVLSF